MATSGMRKGEARQINWRNIIAHKIRHGERMVVCQPGAERYFNRLRKRGRHPEPDDLVFCHADGKPVQEYMGFKPLLTAAGLLKDGKGKDRTICSLRHTYATLRLEHGANVYWLKTNMGASVTMIVRHHGQTYVLSGIEFETAKRKTKPKAQEHAPFTSEQLEQLKQYLLQQVTTIDPAELSPLADDGED
jgi:integrase